MLLPETVLLAVLILGGSYASDHFRVGPGPQQAMAAASSVIQDGVPVPGTKRKQRVLQDRLREAPQELMTLTATDMIGAFGYADLNRQDGQTTILQFRGDECVLDVFLNNAAPVYYEFRARVVAAAGVDDDVRERSCVNDILKSRRI